MYPVIHFEIPAEDRNRVTDFYRKVFGWQAEMLGPDMNDYVLVSTTENDGNGMPKKPGAINGGIYKKSSEGSVHHPSLVIGVDDINTSIEQVNAAGGTVLGKPDHIPGVGAFVYFKDTEGNILGILEPFSMEEE